MLYLYFEDIYLFLPFLLNFFLFWTIFFKLNFFSNRQVSISTDKVQKNNFNYNFHNSFLLIVGIFFTVCFLILLFTFQGVYNTVWWQHFKLTNLSLSLFVIFLLISIFFLLICKNLTYLNYFTKMDYNFAIINLVLFLPLIFFTNTLFTFLFILEFTSIIIFYKFVVSKLWKVKDNYNVNNYILFRNLPTYYLNMLFFQYWSTFFSSVLIVFSLISYIYLYGTTEWFMLNLLYSYSASMQINTVNNFILMFILIFGLLIKIGFTPIHLYKIEVYKGLPFLAIFFYTTFYFLVYFLYFILLVLLHLEAFSVMWLYILLFIVVIGLVFLISLLFSVNYIKAFFAYSSVVNSTGFLVIVLSLLNF